MVTSIELWIVTVQFLVSPLAWFLGFLIWWLKLVTVIIYATGIGVCNPKGYGFWVVWLRKEACILAILLWNRVWYYSGLSLGILFIGHNFFSHWQWNIFSPSQMCASRKYSYPPHKGRVFFSVWSPPPGISMIFVLGPPLPLRNSASINNRDL